MFVSFFFFLGSFTYTSRAGFIFIWGVSLTHPVLGLVLSADLLLHIPCGFLLGEFLLHIPWYLHFYAGSFSYTSRAGFPFYQLTFSYTSHDGFLLDEFLLHIPCWLYFYLGIFSYTSHAGFIFICWVSLTQPMPASFSNPGSFSYTSPCCFHFYLQNLSNIPCCFIFIWGVSLTYPMLTLFLCGELLLHIPRWRKFYWFCFFFYNIFFLILSSEVSLIHPVFVSFLFFFFFSGEFLLHIPC